MYQDPAARYAVAPAQEHIEETQELTVQSNRDTVIHARGNDTPIIELPVSGGRSSVPTTSTFGALIQELMITMPDFNVEFLKALEHLAMYNPDLSMAVENVVTLSNTEYRIEFDDDNLSDEVVKEMMKRISARSKHWYNNSEGLNSLINDLLSQVAVTGALSSETIPNNSLDGVDKVVLVTPHQIRFLYNKEKDRYVPYQQTNTFISAALHHGLVELNEITYKYKAIRRFNEKPYAIPPFLAALENINIERDMLCNLKNVVKKLGAMGFLSVLVNAPDQKPAMQGQEAETDAQYEIRLTEYLNKVASEVEKGLTKGFTVGVKDDHEFDMQTTTSNVEGAEKLFELNTTMKMAGLKQPPSMLGRNYQTTETLGRVLLAKIGTQMRNYQSMVADYLSDIFLMDLRLAGYKVESVKVEFEKPLISDQVRDQEARKLEIENAQKLYTAGLIDQEQFAQMVGLDAPAEEGPRYAPPENGNNNDPDNGGDQPVKDGDGDETDAEDNLSIVAMRKYINRFEEYHRIDYPAFDYNACGHEGCEHDHAHLSLNKADDRLEQWFSKYFNATSEKYRASIDRISKIISKKVSELGAGASAQNVVDAVFYHLYTNWDSQFVQKQAKVIDKYVREIYDEYRKDVTPFGGRTKIDGDDIPAAVFSTPDYRTMDYYRRSDKVYMGRFITDADTQDRLREFIRKEVLTGNVPVGDKQALRAAFEQSLGDILVGEEWKLTRVINTTVNKLRANAAMEYMNQVEVDQFEIRGVPDGVQCPYCASLQGMRFSLEKAVTRARKTASGDPLVVAAETPFVTAVYSKPEDMEGLTADQLQASGIDAPPFHPHCRDRLVAVL